MNGNFVWAKANIGTQNGNGQHIELGPGGFIYLTGWFRGTFDFDPSATIDTINSAGNMDIFIQKLTANGNLIWLTTFGDNGSDYGYDLHVTSQNEIYSTGYFMLSVDFDPSANTNIHTSNGGQRDMYVQKLIQCSASNSNFSVTACNSYQVPSGNAIYTTSGTINDTIPNVSGCDSIMTISLTIDTINTNISVAGNTLTVGEIGATYQWIDCSNNQVISGATSQSYTATSNGNYAVVVTTTKCLDTSSCVAITSVGINQYDAINSLTIYPNPTDKYIYFSDNNTKNIVITDVIGKIVFQKKNITSRVELSSLNKGAYFIIINMDGKNSIKKFIKK